MKKLLIFTLLVISIQASATNYYVKTGGSDAAAGTSDALAWATCQKVTSFMASFAPGDSILFRRGDTFSGYAITIARAGTSANHITLGAYGTGDKPILTFTGTIIYIPNATRGYWTVDNLDLRTSATGTSAYIIDRDYWPGGILGAMEEWTISNCIVRGIVRVSGPNIWIHHNDFDGTARATVGGGILLREENADSALVENNTIHDFGDRGIWVNRGADGGIIRYNEIYDLYTGAGGDHYGTAINLDGYGVPIDSWTVHDNYSHDITGYGISMENTDSTNYYNNIVVGQNSQYTLGFSIWRYDQDIPAGATYEDQPPIPAYDSIHHNLFINCTTGGLINAGNYIFIHNNIFYNDIVPSGTKWGLQTPANTYSTNIEVTNNIFSGAGWQYAIRSAGVATQFSVLDYNLVDVNITQFLYDGYLGARSIAQLQALGFMNNGIVDTPDWITAGTNFNLQSVSPAINEGVALGYDLDIEGNAIGATNVDIGPYEYQVPGGLKKYHVDFTDGLDANSGLTRALAWKTVAKVNSSMASFNPGDSILFQCGETWTASTLTLATAGVQDSNIIISVYGSGAKPIITSSANSPAITITAANRGYWTIDSLDLRSSGLPAGIENTLNIYHAYWSGVDAGTVPGWVIQYCSLNAGVMLSGPNTTIRNNVFIGGVGNTNQGAQLMLRSTNAQNCLIENNTLSDYTDRCIMLKAGAGQTVIRNNTVHEILTGPSGVGYGIVLDGGGVDINDCEIYGNYVYDCVGAGILNKNGFRMEVYDNLIIDCNWGGINIYWYARNFGTNSGIDVHHNIIMNGEYGILMDNVADIKVANNIFYKNDALGVDKCAFFITGVSTYVSAVTLVNNIIEGTWTHFVRVPDTKNIWSTFDYNIIKPAIGTEVMYRAYTPLTLAQVQALGVMAQGNSSDPLFVSPASDWHLQATSPARNTGTTAGYSLDYEGNAIDATPDIGAYEYQGPVSNPHTPYLKIGGKLQSLDGSLLNITIE